VHTFPQSVLGYVRKHDLLRPGDRVGVAVSGGADSVALLRVLLELRKELGVVLSVVHINHSLRSAESDADEQFVRDLSSDNDLPFFSARVDVKSFASEKKLSIETAARQLRYEYFEQLLRKREVNKIATGHTLDDQAETVLLKLVRGAGTRGLAGIYPEFHLDYRPTPKPRTSESERDQLTIVRPLLGSQRSQIEQYLSEIRRAWRDDSSNAELHYTRNKVRHEIIPALCKHLNPQTRQALGESAEIARAEQEFWDIEVQRQLPRVWSRGEGSGSLRCDLLHSMPLALQRRLVRAAVESLGLNLEFGHVEQVLALKEEGARTNLRDGWTAMRQGQLLMFRKSSDAEPSFFEYPLVVPGKVVVAEAGLVLHASSADTGNNDDDPRYNPDHLLDIRFGGELVVRNWRAGDRFWPAHTKGPKKVKELLQDRHITGDKKKRWPLIATGDQVLWLRGFGVGSEFQSSNGRGILILEESSDAE
jgi:tRNA(Ile)-lysidine synthase